MGPTVQHLALWGRCTRGPARSGNRFVMPASVGFDLPRRGHDGGAVGRTGRRAGSQPRRRTVRPAPCRAAVAYRFICASNARFRWIRRRGGSHVTYSNDATLSQTTGAVPGEERHGPPTSAGERAKEVAGTGASGAAAVAHDAKEQAAEVAREARGQAQGLLHDVRADLRGQADQQTSRAGEGLRRLSEQMQALRDGDVDRAGPVLGYTEQLHEKVQDLAQRVEARGFDGMVADLRDVARRRPGAFLLGAAAAGFLAGRVIRSSAGEASGGQSTAKPVSTGVGTAPMADLGPAYDPAAEPLLAAGGPVTPTTLSEARPPTGLS